jgi:hypothetical protein
MNEGTHDCTVEKPIAWQNIYLVRFLVASLPHGCGALWRSIYLSPFLVVYPYIIKTLLPVCRYPKGNVQLIGLPLFLA